MVYSTFRGNAATRLGGLLTSSVVIVFTAHPWLAATPNGWVTDSEASPNDGLVEFKNPYSYRELAVSDVIAANKCNCWTLMMVTSD